MIGPLRRRLDAAHVTTTGRDALLGVVVGVVTVTLFLVVERIAFDEVVAPLIGQGVDAAQLDTGGRAAVIAVILGQAMLLTVRRRSPLLCLVLTVLGQVALATVLPPLMSFQTPATLVAAYSVGAYVPRRGTIGWVALAAAAQALLSFVLTGPAPAQLPGVGSVAAQLWTGLASAVLAFVAATLVGAYVGTRRELETQLRGRVDQAEREREALAAQAVLEERGRMARELHDVAAHHLSGIVVQAAAAERLVDTDPARARESMRWIRTQGRETLDDLRLVVGILRSSDGHDSPADAPQPTLDDLPGLLDLARSVGTVVRHDVRGEAWDLPSNTQRTVYRVVQEALANARRHAAGKPVDLRLDYRRDELVVTARNPVAGGAARSTTPGHGVIGMSERAAVAGGTLTAGPVPGNAWRVRLTVPRGGRTDRTEQEAS